MSRRRQRGAAYRMRRKFRNYAKGRRASPFASYMDPAMVRLLTAPMVAAQLYEYEGQIDASSIVTVTIGPLTARTFPVDYQLMASAARLPECVMFGDNTTELSTEAEVAAFFGVADRVLTKRDVGRDCCLTHCDEAHMPECPYGYRDEL